MEPQIINLEDITKGEWQWRSNPDPWCKSEEPQWKSYSLRENYLIEKGYYDGQKEVDIGDYIIYPQEKVQIKKGSAQAQRSIRRIGWMGDEEMSDRSERYFETEPPKTTNRIHGDLGDFADFFARRNPEMREFTEQFEEIIKKKDLNGLKDSIIPKLVNSLEKELIEPILDVLKNPSLSLFKRKILMKLNKENEELISLFQRDFTSFEDFYGQILRAYTMKASLCPNLNSCLRNEDWIGMDNLLPYAYCLCEAFSIPYEFQRDPELLNIPSQETMFLYRGTAFDEFALSSYNKEKIQHFAWNSITSASTNKQIAEDFMYQSVHPKNKKYPVMFIIEVPAINKSRNSSYLRWMQIRQFSILSKEDETILPPGSIFQLEEVSKDKDEKITIRIKFRDKIDCISFESSTMAYQREMMRGGGIYFSGFGGDDLYEAIRGISGNRLIRRVTFGHCKFDSRSLNELRHISPTLERVKDLTFSSCSYQDEGGLSKIIPKLTKCSCDISKAQICQMDDFCQIVAQCFHICQDQNDFMLLRLDEIVQLSIIAKPRGLEKKRKTGKIYLQTRDISGWLKEEFIESCVKGQGKNAV